MLESSSGCPTFFLDHETGNTNKPGAKSCAVFNTIESLIGTNEHLLGRIFGLGQRPTLSAGTVTTTDRQNQSGVPIVNSAEGLQVPVSDQFKIMAVVVFHWCVHGRSKWSVSPFGDVSSKKPIFITGVS